LLHNYLSPQILNLKSQIDSWVAVIAARVNQTDVRAMADAVPADVTA